MRSAHGPRLDRITDALDALARRVHGESTPNTRDDVRAEARHEASRKARSIGSVLVAGDSFERFASSLESRAEKRKAMADAAGGAQRAGAAAALGENSVLPFFRDAQRKQCAFIDAEGKPFLQDGRAFQVCASALRDSDGPTRLQISTSVGRTLERLTAPVFVSDGEKELSAALASLWEGPRRDRLRYTLDGRFERQVHGRYYFRVTNISERRARRA